MFRKFVFLCGLVFGFGAVPTYAQTIPVIRPAALKHQDIDATLGDTWHGMYSHGKKIGYIFAGSDKVTEKGQTFYRNKQSSRVKLLTLGTKGEIKQDQTILFATKAPYAMVSGKFNSDDGKSQKRISLVAKGEGAYEATVTIGKMTRTSTVNVNHSMMDGMTFTNWVKKGPAKGDTITLFDFDFSELRMNKLSVRMVGTKEIEHEGSKVLASQFEKVEKLDAAEGMTTVVYCNSKGDVLTASIANVFELRKETEGEARKIEFGEDMIFTNMVKIDRPIGNLANVKGMTLRGKGNINGLLPQTALQSVAKDADTGYLVKIGPQHGTKVKAGKDDIRVNLEESEEYPIKDAKVLEMARTAIGDAKTDMEKVNRLCKFVHEFIKYEIVYLPKVDDILERKVGDCKSYALLFTCLARAVGVPAREATGYFYMGDEVKGFGGHAWNEVLLDGHWTPIDATLGHTNLVPFYICVGTGREGRENMARTMGKLSFELVDVELAH